MTPQFLMRLLRLLNGRHVVTFSTAHCKSGTRGIQGARMSILDRDWHAVAGASESAIEQLRKAVACQLPVSYLELLRTTNGGEGPLARQPYYLQLDSAEDVAEAAASKQHEEFFPGFVVIGSNGGGEFIAFDARTPGPLAVVAIDMSNIDLGESVEPIASDFDAFIDLIGIEASDLLSD
jgi:SMI1 / KNR4 family (SUKH-1)